MSVQGHVHVLDDAIGGKLRIFDNIPDEVVQEFVTECICLQPNAGYLLRHLSDMEVFVGMLGSEVGCRKGDITWEKILPVSLMRLMRCYGCCIIGFCLLKQQPVEEEEKKTNTDSNPILLVDHLDTRIEGFNLAIRMMQHIERHYTRVVLPHTVKFENASFWLKYLKTKFGPVKSENDLFDILQASDLAVTQVNWNELYAELDTMEDKKEKTKHTHKHAVQKQEKEKEIKKKEQEEEEEEEKNKSDTNLFDILSFKTEF